jgi:hypothetical protein
MAEMLLRGRDIWTACAVCDATILRSLAVFPIGGCQHALCPSCAEIPCPACARIGAGKRIRNEEEKQDG